MRLGAMDCNQLRDDLMLFRDGSETCDLQPEARNCSQLPATPRNSKRYGIGTANAPANSAGPLSAMS